MPFGQVVIGSPGSGKTTYCNGLQQFLGALKRPNVHIVNLDFANSRSRLPYTCSIDVNSLISVHDVMVELGLGPNGAMLYCIEYLEENIEWLLEKVAALGKEAYVVFDLPGQVELSTNHPSLSRIVKALEKRADCRLVAVHLLDSSHILDPSRYVSLLLLSLRAMLTLELPHINVLSKVDLLGQASGGELPFPLEFYTDPSPSELEPYLATHSTAIHRQRYSALNSRILEIIEDFSLVSFEALAVEDKQSMWRLVRLVDKVGGWVFVHAGDEGGEGEDEDEDEAMPDDLKRALEAEYPDDDQRPKASAASALSLFTTLDSGVPPGWGSAADVQERYVDSYRDEPRGEDERDAAAKAPAMTEEEFSKYEEERIYSAWREWKREEEERKRNNAPSADAQDPATVSATGMGRDGMRIKEKWKRQG